MSGSRVCAGCMEDKPLTAFRILDPQAPIERRAYRCDTCVTLGPKLAPPRRAARSRKCRGCGEVTGVDHLRRVGSVSFCSPCYEKRKNAQAEARQARGSRRQHKSLATPEFPNGFMHWWWFEREDGP